MSQNELALQFFGAGFFNPQLSDQALACLDMMDFDRKSFVMQKIAENGTLYERLMAAEERIMMLSQAVDQIHGTNLAAAEAANAGSAAPMPSGRDIDTGNTDAESGVTRSARERVAESAAPR